MTRHVAKPGRAKRKKSRSLPLIAILGGGALLGLAAIAVLLGGREEYSPEVTGGPSLRADRQEENIGDVPLGQTVRVSFEISNVGDGQLRFSGAPYVEVVEGC
jgi:hypothetical protein